MLTKDKLLERKAELQTALQQVADEYQRLQGAIQLLDALVAELDEPAQQEQIK